VTGISDTIEVANMSLGGGFSQALNDAVKRGTDAGIVFVVAAGNDNANAANYSPASAPTAITVSALADSDGLPGGTGANTSYGPDDSLASFSNYGSAVDIAAPGVDILSTYLSGGYAIGSGTSMASPHVAGAAALYMAGVSPRPSVAAVTVALLGSGWTTTDTCCYFDGDRDSDPEPLLNVAGLMGTAVEPPPPVDNQPPIANFNYHATDLTVQFTDTSSDSDGTIQSWSWSFGDETTSTAQHPSHMYAAGGTYTVTLTVTDDDNATAFTSQLVTVTAPPPPQPGGIVLTATGYKVRGRQQVDLIWTGATGDTVTIYRNNSPLPTAANNGAYTDTIGAVGGGTYVYSIEAENGTSNQATVTF
jgi:subtilisin